MRSIYDTMQLLLRRSLDHMDLDELEVLTGATDFAESEARRLSAVLQGIGCLVAEDGLKEGGTGSFQDAESVFDLLCSVSHGLDTIAGLIHLGEEAGMRAQQMRKASES